MTKHMQERDDPILYEDFDEEDFGEEPLDEFYDENIDNEANDINDDNLSQSTGTTDTVEGYLILDNDKRKNFSNTWIGSQYPQFYWTTIKTSDVIIALTQKMLQEIVEQRQHNLQLDCQLPEGTSRIWLYETGGVMGITFLMFTQTLPTLQEIEDKETSENLIPKPQESTRQYMYPVWRIYEALPSLKEERLKIWNGWNGLGAKMPDSCLMDTIPIIGMQRVF
jgi:hypothetical protein